MIRKLALSVTLVLALPLGAQTSPGYSPQSAATERATEADVISRPSPASASAHSKFLSFQPHMAGTPAQVRTRDYVVNQMKSWGLETEVRSYSVWMPHPVSTRVWRIAPDPVELNLQEGPIPEDTTSVAFPQVMAFNGYGAAGDVTADVVYVNYGLIEDYAQLDSLGVSVQGKIAIARYGRSFRGIKAREAERHGAVGLIIYSDPQDDGYFRGDVYPAGAMRPPFGIQRGSILNVNGDPTTPGYASLPGARRVPEDSLPVPHIPVVPMGYGNAQKILGVLGGGALPQAWQGGLPFRYHAGPGPARVRLLVRREHGARAMHTIWDTFGMIRGTTAPDEWVIVGGHRDAWSPGTADNISGTVTVLEAARAFAQLARQGIRPARTLIFATWDAEEWGLIGSTEWTEQMEDQLRAHAVAYINEDDVTQGLNFGGDGSPSLKHLIRDAAHVGPDPAGTGSVFDVWVKRTKGDSGLGNMGGGSDFQGFYHHIGIPAGGIGFGGPGGVYHSMYDSYDWLDRFGDKGYREHQATARFVSILMARLGNAQVAPLD